MRVLIAGAGIAGLTAALSLLPHAVRELTELGLGEQLAQASIETAEQAHFAASGGFIWSEPRGRGLGYRWPQYSIHRGRLQMILLDAVRDRLGLGAVATGTAVTGFTEGEGGAEVRLSARPNGFSRLERGGLLLRGGG